jgi:hypothetical protein
MTTVTENHPSSVMSRAELRSQNRPGSFALLAKNSCRSASDPETAIGHVQTYHCNRPLKLTLRQPLQKVHE